MNSPQNFKDIVSIFLDLITTLTPVVVGLALLAFFWGLVQFIVKSGDAKTHAAGRDLMVWGVIALFVMFSVFGIVRFFQADLGFNSANHPFGIPTLPTSIKTTN